MKKMCKKFFEIIPRKFFGNKKYLLKSIQNKRENLQFSHINSQIKMIKINY